MSREEELAEAVALLEQHPNHLWLSEYVRILRGENSD